MSPQLTATVPPALWADLKREGLLARHRTGARMIDAHQHFWRVRARRLRLADARAWTDLIAALHAGR